MGKRISYLDTNRAWTDAIETAGGARRAAVSVDREFKDADTHGMHTHVSFREGLHAIPVTNARAELSLGLREARGMSFEIYLPCDMNGDVARTDADTGRIPRPHVSSPCIDPRAGCTIERNLQASRLWG